MTDTPFLTVDVARLDTNIGATAARARATDLQLRPHAKTHKCAQIAQLQLDAGAVGLTVATIGEAEAFADAALTGRRDLFIAYPLWVTEHKGARLRALADRIRLRVAIDSVDGARRLAAETADVDLEVVVEVDSGQHRTGVDPDQAGVIARTAVESGLRVVGLFTFPGHGYGPGDARRRAADNEVAAISRAADRLRDNGIDPVVRSGGSTPTIEFAGTEALTEIRPGVYPFNDAQQVELGSCDLDAVALCAVGTVVHRTGRRIVADTGSKILGADRPPWTSGFGRLLDAPDARITSLSEHHAVIDYPRDDDAIPELGARVRVVPNHVCTAVNLVDHLYAEAADGTSVRWPVIARGANS
ncbi:alanine racemase [Gordonia insulae]|uniref:D-threo-3-hydroxyaspartate dehydratase n=1 Tax=Gordonia insulae TaxID=2420509 RepID=A0A3G8JJX8_9ACTN|nr:alanine racemase [Gordonia insulae]AZG44925.1 D-threo-3-hydroxyaspartate dehydratase [Gordonia insulae]